MSAAQFTHKAHFQHQKIKNLMHILVIPSWFGRYAGDPSGSFFETQATGLKAIGEQVGIIYPDLRPITQAKLSIGKNFDSELRSGVNILRKTYINWTPRIEQLILPRWISVGMALFDEYCELFGKPDIIHAHCLLRAGILASKINSKYGIPFIVTEHSSRWHRHEVTTYELQHAQTASKSASALISVSNALLPHLTLDLEVTKTYIVPNAVDSVFLETNLKERNSEGPVKFINVALFNPGKRHDILIDSFYSAFGRDTDHRLYLIGDGPERASIEKKISGYGMGSIIHLLGLKNKRQVADLLSSSDCFVLTSEHETFGVVTIEALACGIPIVSTNCGGTDDIVSEDNGILIKTNNTSTVAESLNLIAQKIVLGQYNREHLRTSCREKYSQESICSRLVDIYHSHAKKSR